MSSDKKDRFVFTPYLIKLFVFLYLFTCPVLFAATAQQKPLSVKTQDVDGDGLKDVSIETHLLRVIISSKTGNPSVYYLKGQNFEENMYPPVLQDMGYTYASDTLTPFDGKLLEKGENNNFGYQVSVSNNTGDEVVINAIANIPGKKFKTGGLSVQKKYVFKNSSYQFDVQYIVSSLADKLVQVGTDKGSLKFSFGPGIFMDPFKGTTLVALKADSVETYSSAKSLNEKASSGNFTGIGLKDQYFCILLDAKQPVKISAKSFKVKSPDPRKKVQKGDVISFTLPKFNLGAKETRAFNFKIYAGPILYDDLKKIHREKVSGYGFLSTFLLRILQFFYFLFPNYGLAIILLTLVVRAGLYPLTLKQTRSMAQMQKIQPQVQDLKDRYKDDSQKFNEEVLKLYQKHKVNPLGGCLPLILQLPILIALYNTIRIAVELRKTPFLWIPDLSKGDPYYLLPAAIALLMYYQQTKMSGPQQAQQKQMMTMMPIIMFMITWSLPAGLLVYWAASSVIGLFQQIQATKMVSAVKEE